MKTAVCITQPSKSTNILESKADVASKPSHRPARVSSVADTKEEKPESGGTDRSMEQALKLAWAAGFVDGDGCICPVIQRHKDRATDSIRIRLVITQNDHHVLDVLQRVLGERRALNGLKRQDCQNRHPYQLQYDGGHAIAAIKKIRPFLIRKAREADLCMQLFVEGRLNQSPGPKGFPPEVHRIRKALVKRIRRMK